MARRAECEELCFLRKEGHIVALAKFEGKEEKIAETVDVIRRALSFACPIAEIVAVPS